MQTKWIKLDLTREFTDLTRYLGLIQFLYFYVHSHPIDNNSVMNELNIYISGPLCTEILNLYPLSYDCPMLIGM